MHQLQELVRLHRMQTGAREVARLLGISPNTERRYRRAFQAAQLLQGPPEVLPELATLREAVAEAHPTVVGKQEISTAEPWETQVSKMVGNGATPKAIFDTLKREVEGFDASYWAVKRLCKRLKAARGVREEDVAVRVTTAPGKEAQVDFGYVGRLYDPERCTKRKAWVFVMTLSYSRHVFCRIVFDQSTATWLSLHAEAFTAFGGAPEVIRPDNLKAAVIRAAFGTASEPALNRSYRELARHYGIKIDPTPPRQPKKKGKVERSVRYVKENFFAPLAGDFEDIHDANRRLDRWVLETAGVRTHGTTGWQPLAQFESVEKEVLLPLPARPFQLIIWKRAKVHQDCHFLFECRTYPVPWRFVGKEVWVRAVGRSLEIYLDDERIITHERDAQVPDAVLDRCLPTDRAQYRHRGREFWEQRADAIDAEVGIYIREVLDSDEALSKVRVAQQLVTLFEKHPVARVIAACRRASFYGSYDYTTVRNVLRQGLDLEPLPTAVSPAHGRLENPRYARTVAELLHLPLESQNEHH